MQNFVADPGQLLAASACGIVLLLVMIIKFKIHPFLSLLVCSLAIGVGCGMTPSLLTTTMEQGAGKTLQGIVLLIGLGSMFGGILEVSGGAKCVAQTLIHKFGEAKTGVALGVAGLVVGTTVFFEAGVMILIPLAFSLARRTQKSTLLYAIPMLAGLASAFAFIPPSAGSVLVANLLGVDLGLMILVGVPTGALALLFAGIFYAKYIGNKIIALPPESESSTETNGKLPNFGVVVVVILTPLLLIVLGTLTQYLPALGAVTPIIQVLSTPFVALLVTILLAMYLLGKKQGYTLTQTKDILDNALKPTAGILLVITGGGILSEVLQVCGMGEVVSAFVERAGLPLILCAFLIAALIRICVGAAVVSMTMTAGIMMSMPAVATLSPLYLAAMVLAINGGATAFSHVNDSGFWMVSSLLHMEEKDTLKSWTAMETIIGLTGLAVALVICTVA